TEKGVAAKFFGKNGTTKRLGRASMLRGLSKSQYDKMRKEGVPPEELGPYLPTIIEACAEGELSYEYRHGATSHGAFTFSLASILRKQPAVSFQALVDLVKAQLAELEFAQEPRILGPSEVLAAKIPWAAGSSQRR
ncbi:MAG: caspase family protein, partial [Hyphomicrobiaceae bacterium]